MSARRALDLSLALLAVAVGCSVWVDPRAAEPRCESSEAGASEVCPQGTQCIEGRCRVGCPADAREVCSDNIDNDCDGAIDEVDTLGREICGDTQDNDCDGAVDEGADSDGDGFTWCGDIVDPLSDLRDCDDMDNGRYPGAPEVCDGLDNDCDGQLDEETGEPLCPEGQYCSQRCRATSCNSEGGPLQCAADERCDVATGQCVPVVCGDTACAAEEYCDTASETCKPRQRRPNGAECAVASDCSSDSCIDAAAMRFAGAGRICGQACCSDAQCKEGERCFASGSGARSCLPLDLIPPRTPRHCISDQGCDDGELCGLTNQQQLDEPTYVERDDVITSACLNASLPAPLRTGDRCVLYPECATRVCVGGIFTNLCSNPCGTSNDCAELAAEAKRQGAPEEGAYCRFVNVTLGDAPPDYAAVCVVKRSEDTGSGVYGEECSTGADCQEGGCVQATRSGKGRCSPTCCHDSQCGPREDGQPIVCRPFAFGDRYEMRCGI